MFTKEIYSMYDGFVWSSRWHSESELFDVQLHQLVGGSRMCAFIFTYVKRKLCNFPFALALWESFNISWGRVIFRFIALCTVNSSKVKFWFACALYAAFWWAIYYGILHTDFYKKLCGTLNNNNESRTGIKYHSLGNVMKYQSLHNYYFFLTLAILEKW